MNAQFQTDTQPAAPGSRRATLAICFLLALAVWAVYGQTLHHDFVNYDDDFNAAHGADGGSHPAIPDGAGD